MKLPRRGMTGLLPLMMAVEARGGTGSIQIYAAMTFRSALDDVLRLFRNHGAAADAVYGPTPVLVRQLAAGAPADILLTADADWMDKAAGQGLVRPETRTNLLANELVLAGPLDVPQPGEITREFKLDALLGGGRLAMCDPDHDPAGRYARQSLETLGFWPDVASQIVTTETSLAAVTLVDRGEARAAACFATDLRGDSRAARIGRFPSDSHAPIVYPAALTKAAREPDAAVALAFLGSTAAQHVFSSFGYVVATT